MEQAAPKSFNPTQIDSIGVGMSDDQRKLFLVLRLLDFVLGFEGSMTTLRELAKSFNEMLKALDAPEDQRH